MRWRIVRAAARVLAVVAVFVGLCLAALAAAAALPLAMAAGACGFFVLLACYQVSRIMEPKVPAPAVPPMETIRGDVIVFLDGTRPRAFANAGDATFVLFRTPDLGAFVSFLEGDLAVPYEGAQVALSTARSKPPVAVYIGFPDGRKIHGMLLDIEHNTETADYPAPINRMMIKVTKDSSKWPDTPKAQALPKSPAGPK